MRRSSDKFRAVLAAVAVLVVLLGVSQLFRGGQPDPAAPVQEAQTEQAQQASQPTAQATPDQATQNPQAGQVDQGDQAGKEGPAPVHDAQGPTAAPSIAKPGATPFDERTSHVAGSAAPATLVPQDAPLHGYGRDYELEALIEDQKRWVAGIDLKARDKWFDVQTPHEWTFEPNGRKTVYLTFDDGPSPLTPQVLEILDRYGAKATFFVTAAYPDYFYLIKEAYDKGHTIALHTASHDYAYVYSSIGCYYDDLATIGGVVEEQIGYVPAFIRFPG
ncbi:MAG: polysaccharide deacetylase family protein, partial [Eggerthellaceae bacterium]|nr:polysaccharide deacetylase family protein [Eggerthellaceae bacterium]